jgi:hypothetical protein
MEVYTLFGVLTIPDPGIPRSGDGSLAAPSPDGAKRVLGRLRPAFGGVPGRAFFHAGSSRRVDDRARAGNHHRRRTGAGDRDQGCRHRRRLPGRAPVDLQRPRDRDPDRGRLDPDADRGGAAAPRRRSRPRGRHGHDRRPVARRRRRRHRRPDHRARRRRDPRPDLERDRRPRRQRRARRQGRRALVDPPRPARVPRALADRRDLRDGPQGRRPDRAVRQGREGRALRRRRHRQDGADPGADPQRRAAARRRLGLRGRRRADARGQRPLPRDDRVGGDRQGRPRVRPDERAAGRAPARRALRPDDGRVLPRPGPGHAALHRQHLPLRAGGLRGVGAPRPDAERRRLPADARDGDGPAPGADHVHAHRLGDVGAGDLRPGRRPHGPRAGEHVRAPRRDDRALPRDRREGDLPGGRPARFGLARAHARDRLGGALRRRHARPAGAAALQGPAGHHRDPRHGRADRRGQARRLARPQGGAVPLAAELRRRAVHRHPGPVREARGHDQGLPRDHRGQARRPARGCLLHGRHDRAGGREGGEDAAA